VTDDQFWKCWGRTVGVSRAAGDRRERTSLRQGTTLKSRAQVTGCASSVGLHALLGRVMRK